MRPPPFWSDDRAGIAAMLLAPAAALYGTAVRLRARAVRPYRSTVPVVCVGNPGLGGAGKTPTAIAIARRLAALGAAPHFLSRGYGGALSGPVTVEPGRHGAADVGDEPLLLARHAPTHVARDRAAGAHQAEAAGAGVIVMDDGYQNPSLARDCSILVVDGQAGIGNGCVFPAGPLREDIDAQLSRADAVVVVGDGAAGERVAAMCRERKIAVLSAALRPDVAAPDLAGRDVVAFCAIALPGKFAASLAAVGADVVEMVSFADHHRFTRRDIVRILGLCGRHPGAALVTTEKDLVRVGPGNDPQGDLRARVQALPVEMVFDEPGRLDRLLEQTVLGWGPACAAARLEC